MGIEKDIQQDKFRNIYQKAYINLIYTVGWMRDKTKSFLKMKTLPRSNSIFSVFCVAASPNRFLLYRSGKGCLKK